MLDPPLGFRLNVAGVGRSPAAPWAYVEPPQADDGLKQFGGIGLAARPAQRIAFGGAIGAAAARLTDEDFAG